MTDKPGYTGQECPNCKRERLFKTTDSKGVIRIVCDKCGWEPEINDYAPDNDEEHWT